jgi:hypothetical protein
MADKMSMSLSMDTEKDMDVDVDMDMGMMHIIYLLLFRTLFPFVIITIRHYVSFGVYYFRPFVPSLLFTIRRLALSTFFTI